MKKPADSGSNELFLERKVSPREAFLERNLQERKKKAFMEKKQKRKF